MGRRKKTLVVEEEPKVYIPPVEDTYGFGRTKACLEKNKFSVEQVSGVIYVRLNKDEDFNEAYKEVERIITEQKFRGSWGVSY